MLPPVRFREGSAAAAIASEVVLGDARPTRRRGRAFASAATIAAVLLAAYAAWRWLEATGGAVSLLERFGLMAPFVSIPVHVLLSATPFPSEVIGVANGSVYGLWVGALCSWIGWWCGAVLEYTLVRLGARHVEWADAVGHLPRWLRRFPVGHPVFLIVGRQLPFGFHTVNVVAGLAGVSGRRQVICAAVSNVPYAFFCTAVGAGIIAAR